MNSLYISSQLTKMADSNPHLKFLKTIALLPFLPTPQKPQTVTQVLLFITQHCS